MVSVREKGRRTRGLGRGGRREKDRKRERERERERERKKESMRKIIKFQVNLNIPRYSTFFLHRIKWLR